MKITGTVNRIFGLLVITAGAGSFWGCSVVDYHFGEQRFKSLEGEPLSEVKRAIDLEFYDGRLVVANQGMARGIAFVDTGTETVAAFISLKLQPMSTTWDHTGRILLGQRDDDFGSAVGWIDLSQRSYHSWDSISAQISTPFGVTYGFLTATNGQIFGVSNNSALFKPYALHLNSIQNNTMTAGSGFACALDPTSIEIAQNRLFVAMNNSSVLLIRNAQAPFSLIDSVNLVPGLPPHDTRTSISSMTHWEGKIFAVVNRGDSSRIVVVDAATHDVTSTIPAVFKGLKSAGVQGRQLVLYGQGRIKDSAGNRVLDGGIEAIDLDNETHSGVLASEASIGGPLLDYVAINSVGGYALYYNYQEGWETSSIRRVRY